MTDNKCSPDSEGLSAYFNPPRVKIAAYLLARDEAEISQPVPDELIAWATQLLKVGMTSEHSGDCTKESHACNRCIADRTLNQADVILSLGVAQKPLTQEQVARALAGVSWERGGNEHAKAEFIDRRWPHYRMEADAILLALTSTQPLCSCKASTRDGQHMAWCPAVTSTDQGGK